MLTVESVREVSASLSGERREVMSEQALRERLDDFVQRERALRDRRGGQHTGDSPSITVSVLKELERMLRDTSAVQGGEAAATAEFDCGVIPDGFTREGWTLAYFGKHVQGCAAGPSASKRHMLCDCGLSVAIERANRAASAPSAPTPLSELVTCCLNDPYKVVHPRRLDCRHEAPHLIAACGAFKKSPAPTPDAGEE